MSGNIYLLGFSALTPSGLYSHARHETWEEGFDVLSVRREQVLNRPYPSFGKLESTDRLAFAAASLLFSDGPDLPSENTGISLAVVNGSLPTDIRYQQSLGGAFPSPALFSATLPSSALSEVAICYGLKGPMRVVVGPESFAPALYLAARAVRSGKAQRMLFVMVHVSEEEFDSHNLLYPGPTQAIALLLGNDSLRGYTKRFLCSLRAAKPAGGTREDDVYSLVVDVLRNGQGSLSVTTTSWHVKLELTEDNRGRTD